MPFDLLGEVGTLEPWLWRGWRYAFSSQYRAQRQATWKASSNLCVVTDIVLCIVVMGLEIALFGVAVHALVN